ncbi:27858_t:CDS:1, partial [Gigaspora margarita]
MKIFAPHPPYPSHFLSKMQIIQEIISESFAMLNQNNTYDVLTAIEEN